MRCARPARRLSSAASWSSSASISRRSFSISSDIGGKKAHPPHALQLAQLVQRLGGDPGVRLPPPGGPLSPRPFYLVVVFVLSPPPRRRGWAPHSRCDV